MGRLFDERQLVAAAQHVRQLMAASRSTVVFTGAGISTESGVPDFRSPGGVWTTNRMIEFGEFVCSSKARVEYWQQKAAQCREFGAATPNVTHEVLAALERDGLLGAVITQNIDGLHQAAGSQRVLELHGTARRVSCLECDWSDNADDWNERFLSTGVVPDCPACGGTIKHATVSFGQLLPEDVLRESIQLAREADVFLALGSSLLVEPAASLPRIASEQGAQLVIVNRDPTPLDRLSQTVINAPLGQLFTLLRP